MVNFKHLTFILLMSCSISNLHSLEPEGYAYQRTQRAATISPWAAVGAVVIVATAVALVVNGSDSHGHSH